MATMTAQRKYCFPQEQPATKQELNDYFHNLANNRGQNLSFEEHFKGMDEWLKNL